MNDECFWQVMDVIAYAGIFAVVGATAIALVIITVKL